MDVGKNYPVSHKTGLTSSLLRLLYDIQLSVWSNQFLWDGKLWMLGNARISLSMKIPASEGGLSVCLPLIMYVWNGDESLQT